MEIHAVVFENNQRELINSNSLFTDKTMAEKVRDDWNADVPACETRGAVVVPWFVK